MLEDPETADFALGIYFDVVTGEDLQRIRQATERLAQMMGSLAEARTPGAEAAAGEAQGPDDRPGVVDAEFEETKKPDDRQTG